MFTGSFLDIYKRSLINIDVLWTKQRPAPMKFTDLW